MFRMLILDRQATIKQIETIEEKTFSTDCVSVVKNTITTPFVTTVSEGDIIIIKNSEVEYIGCVSEVTNNDDITTTISFASFDEFFNINGFLGSLSGTIYDFISTVLTENFVSITDNKAKLPITIVDGQSTAYTGTYTFDDIGNIQEAFRNLLYYNGTYLDYSLSYDDDKKISGIIVTVKNNNDTVVKKLRYDTPTLKNIKRTFTQDQNTNKLILIPEDTGDTYYFYLLKDGTISTNASASNRFENVKQTIKTYTTGSTAEELVAIAEEELNGQEFNNNIKFDIYNNKPYSFNLYDRVEFIDSDGVTYNSFISAISKYPTYKSITLGVVRTSLTSKLNKASSTTSSSSSSSSGSSYVLPQATGTVLGGILAGTKDTSYTVEVKIDTSSGKLYVPTYTNDVSSVNGHTGAVVLTKTDIGLGNVDNTADANKNVLSATKLTTARNIAGVSFDGTADISIPFANLTSKPTTLSGYGITDAVPNTRTVAGKALSSNITLASTDLTDTANIARLTAPTNIAGTEQATAKFMTANGGSLTIGKEGPNSGTMLRLDQVDGTARLRFRSSATAGAMVWSQLEANAALYMDLADSAGVTKRITFNALQLSHPVKLYAPTIQATTLTNGTYNYSMPSATGTLALTTNITNLVKNTFTYTTTDLYSTKYLEDNFAPMLYTTTYYGNRSGTTTANLTSTIPTLSASNYMTATTTNTSFLGTPQYIYTNTLPSSLTLDSLSQITISIPFSISVASQTVNFGYVVKMGGVSISSMQYFGATAYTGGSGHTDVHTVQKNITTDLLTTKNQYAIGTVMTIEIYTQQATSTSMTMRIYCGTTIGEVGYYSFSNLAQFRAQLSNASPAAAGIIYGHTSETDYNSFYGYKVGNYNTTGSNNTAMGSNSLYANTTGWHNTAIGGFTLKKNTTGSGNTCIGSNSLYANTTGDDNTGVGSHSLTYNTTGYYNTAIGAGSLTYNTIGFYNIGIGRSLHNNTTGYNNIAIGYNALVSNITGYDNMAIGHYALSSSTASNNTAIGSSSLTNNTTGYDNTVIGEFTLGGNTTGSGNIGVGAVAGTYITGGITANTICNNSIFIGTATKAYSDNQTNEIVIGYDTTGHGSNTATWGNASITNHYFTGNVRIPTLYLGGTAITPTATELNYVGGVTSAIQTQLNNKANTDASNITGNESAWVTKLASELNSSHSFGRTNLWTTDSITTGSKTLSQSIQNFDFIAVTVYRNSDFSSTIILPVSIIDAYYKSTDFIIWADGNTRVRFTSNTTINIVSNYYAWAKSIDGIKLNFS